MILCCMKKVIYILVFFLLQLFLQPVSAENVAKDDVTVTIDNANYGEIKQGTFCNIFDKNDKITIGTTITINMKKAPKVYIPEELINDEYTK